MNNSSFQSSVHMLFVFFLALFISVPSFGAGPVKITAKDKAEAVRATESPSDRIQGASGQSRAIIPNGSGTAVMDVTEQASERNRQACLEWCETNPDCNMCRASGLCGTGYRVLKTWGGPGLAWDACKFVSRAPRVHPRPPEGPPEIPGQRKTPIPPIPR